MAFNFFNFSCVCGGGVGGEGGGGTGGGGQVGEGAGEYT